MPLAVLASILAEREVATNGPGVLFGSRRKTLGRRMTAPLKYFLREEHPIRESARNSRV